MNREFWAYLQRLVDTSEWIIERPKGSMHPRFTSQPYPADYGYLLQTTSSDMHEADIWIGSLNGIKIDGVLCSVDLYKRDVELTILINCTDDEISEIEDFTNSGQMRTLFVRAEDIHRRVA